MKKLVAVLAALAALAFASTALAKHHEVKVEQKEGVGAYLTDTEGNTLYWFKKDMANMSMCTGECVDKWPLFFREKVGATGDMKAEEFGTITREDGKKQSTFRGWPLYYFAGDKKAGETNGNKVKDVWFTVDPANFPPK